MTIEEFKIEVLPIKNKLYRLALRLLGSQADAEDAVQEVFLKLWARREKLNEYRSIEAFAMIITKNLCFDKLKLKSRNQQELTEERVGSKQDTPETQMEMKNTVSKIHEIINELPEQQKLVIQLRDIEQCDFDEIAEITNMNLNTIRVNLSRARKKVRDTLLKIQNYEFSSN
ncbi:MAG: RNA polymerase subunit sigma-24 [Bacteroidetes bacterium]|nr:RNA polymerase subunit sigma-24 [Bacteroidota bacterium]